MSKEIIIEKDHIRQARALGAICIKGNIEGRAAFPDQLILKPKGFYWVEFKTMLGSLQDDQIEMHKLLRKKGHRVYVCNSKNSADYTLSKEFEIL